MDQNLKLRDETPNYPPLVVASVGSAIVACYQPHLLPVYGSAATVEARPTGTASHAFLHGNVTAYVLYSTAAAVMYSMYSY